ncbi:class I adenylate-forming enzyme family protein [Oceanobacillus salinisoli]|uniref:class I adenylate-forming enzyme family protein n=1 Tax=Oceanobacillus salinisoli TaxID=2678611 RepID=UPI0012E2E239|nr:class I adenylate-forming enzyme family protein [Oceanobacillus salinisoli]
MNIASYINRAVHEYPDKVALRVDDLEVTYGNLNKKAHSLANYLQENGFKKGDKLGVFMPNCPDYVISMYAAWIIGGVAVPMNYRFQNEELAFLCEDSEISWIVTTANDYNIFQNMSIRVITQTDVKETISLESIYQMEGNELDIVPCLDADTALLMYTSGSTGRPKGVRQTHRTNTASADMVIEIRKLTSEDHILLTVPLFHVGGFQCATLPLLFTGGTITFQPNWNAQEWITLSRDLKPTWSGLATTMIIDVVNYLKVNSVDKSWFRTYRFMIYGGSPTPDPILEFFEDELEVKLVEIYGQTELSGLVITYWGEENRKKGSMGRIVNQVIEGKVIGTDGKEILPGEEESGELYVRGDVVTPGYWKRPELNKERLIDGWLRTGDVVRWDKDGYLYYTDRFDDMIITGGENVYPKEVENVLAEHPKIAEIVVIGTPHERLVEQVTAVIVPNENTLTEKEIIDFCDEHTGLAGYKKPRRIIFTDEIPKTGSGKFNKSLLKKMYKDNKPESTTASQKE